MQSKTTFNHSVTFYELKLFTYSHAKKFIYFSQQELLYEAWVVCITYNTVNCIAVFFLNYSYT